MRINAFIMPMYIPFGIKVILYLGLISCFKTYAVPKVIIDANVAHAFHFAKKNKWVSTLVFFKTQYTIVDFIKEMENNSQSKVVPLQFMPAVVLTTLRKRAVLEQISHYPGIAYVALNMPASEKIEINPETHKPKIQSRYPGIDKWWAHNFKGQSAVIGIIDSGIDPTHPAFITKKIIINKTKHSGYFSYPNGIRSPHGTGVACIYAGYPLDEDDHIRGVSYKAPVILSTIAGEGDKVKENFWLTYSGLNWIFSLNSLRPSVINYSFGNGEVSCLDCPDWSGMSKVVDYIVNTYKILWVTSAGNNGYIKPTTKAPFASTLTIPADNYNALTVANMDMYPQKKDVYWIKNRRESHAIRYSSSRGPTLLGRKKPDIAAPGNNTFTCAPDPKKFHFNYRDKMNYEEGYRLMGGTSAAAPHVGGAVVLLQEAGITNPMAIKALLINSADGWTDSKQPGPNDPHFTYKGGHYPVQGSEWNPTYGWGYLNMDHAFDQRKHIILNSLTLKRSIIEYKMNLRSQDKVTLVHERRVGFSEQGIIWDLSHLQLQLLDAKTRKLLAIDNSPLDTVHQVSLCSPNIGLSCKKGQRDIIVVISLLSSKIDGATREDFALAYS